MQHTFPGATLSEDETKRLLKAAQRDLNGCGEKRPLDCVATTDVALGRLGKGVLAKGDNSNLCGVTGNCAFFVYVRTKNGYRLILGGEGMGEATGWAFAVVPSKGRVPDLVFASNSSASENDLTLFRYVGDRYVERGCERLLAKGETVTSWWDPSQVRVQPCDRD